MPYHFADYTFDVDRRELWRGSSLIEVEPQVFDLMHHLIRHADRLVSKDELLEVVWGGRFVSDSALTTRLNAARKAVGDSGDKQDVIKTIARRGYRFVAELRQTVRDAGATPPLPAEPAGLQADAGNSVGEARDQVAPPNPARRRSIAVMPFVNLSEGAYVRGGLGNAIAQDVTTRLAKLRVLFVTSERSAIALHERGETLPEAARLLNVDYIVGGKLTRDGTTLRASVELTEVLKDRIVWAETFSGATDDILTMIEEIGTSIVNGVAGEIEALERNRAILRPARSLDAWEAYHRGLWHIYRFDKPNNEQARTFFQLAAQLDSSFSRAFAGLSFAHWQNAFQGWGDPAQEADRAMEAAGQGLMADDRDPAAHWAMGRALWLHDATDHALSELQHAVDLSPSFASAHYSMAFVQSQSGDAEAAIDAADRAMALSPYDPMLFAMLATRALALIRLGRYDEAADWGERAAIRPNAHAHILAIAYNCHVMAGRDEPARRTLSALRERAPDYRFANFARAFHLTAATEAQLRRHAVGAGKLS